MRNYETIAIFDPALQDEALKKEIKKCETLLQAGKVATLNTNNWGRREIAYSVGKFKHGHFVCFTYETENHELVDTFQQQLRLNESVVKFQSHRLNLPRRKFKGRVNPKGVQQEWGSDDYSYDSDARY